MSNFNIEQWISDYTKAMQNTFKDRVCFIGLQGSYGRGEATSTSDIDVVLILDNVTYKDLSTYGSLLDTLPNRDMVCGFVSGKSEIEAWEKSDLFQFCNDTTAIAGSLDALMQTITENDVKRAIRIGSCNIYHACIHNAVHEKSFDILKSLYKSAAFTLQAIVFLQKDIFEKKQTKLAQHLQPKDRRILEKRLELKSRDSISEYEFEELSNTLLKWAASWIVKMGSD